jgi:hypothetical protein
MPNVAFKATLCDREDGVTCIEEMSLGGKVTIFYTVVEHEKDSYLVEERSVTAIKLLTPFLRHREGPIPKTKNLLQVLGYLDASREMLSALSELNCSIVYENSSSITKKEDQV